MKKLPFIFSIFLFTLAKAQNVFILTSGGVLYEDPAPYINGQAPPPVLTLENLDLISNGYTNQFSIRFSGNANSTVSGSGGPDGIYYNQFDIAKTSGAKLVLLQNPHVHGYVTFTSGYLDLNGHVLCLFTSGRMVDESENSRVIGPSGGYVQYKQHPASTGGGPSTGIEYGYFDNVTSWVRRGHVTHTGNLGTGTGIQRYFQFTAVESDSPNPTVSVRMKYFESELNGLNENDLVFWSSADMINWTNKGYTNRNTIDNYVELSNITNFQDKYFTLAPAYSPRPIASSPQPIKSLPGPRTKTIATNWKSWPNPVDKTLYIDINCDLVSSATTSIFDSRGILIRIQTDKLVRGSNRLKMDLKNIAPGIYHVVTNWAGGNQKQSSSFVKL